MFTKVAPQFWLLSKLTICLMLLSPLSVVGQDDTEPETEEVKAPTLLIGSEAPELDIENWLFDDSGSFLHTTDFEQGQIYVIDFWDVAWVPTTRMLPRLAELQKQFKNDNVQIISIGRHEVEFTERFLDQRIPNQKKGERKTYRDIAETYSFTCDADRSTFRDYFEASGRTQVPSSFVVGKDGKIEWIGHPKDLEEVLTDLVNGKWDRDKFAEAYAIEMEKQAKIAKAAVVFAKAMEGFPQALNGGRESALEYLEEAFKAPENVLAQFRISQLRVQLMVGMKHSDAAAELRKFADAFVNDEDSAGELNEMIWSIYERHESDADIDSDVLEASLYAARIAVKFLPNSGAINDTVAHFVYLVEEDLDEAIEWQKKAVANAEGREADLQPFLDELLAEKKAGKKTDDKSDKSKKKKKSDF